jgi:hypothetical protein
MNEARWERLGAATGIVYFILTAIAIFFYDVGLPSAGDSADDVRRFFDANASTLAIQSLLGALGLVFFLWWVGSVRSVIAQAEGGTARLAGVAFAGGLAFAILQLMAMAIQGQLAAFIGFEEEIVPTDAFLGAVPVLITAEDGFLGVGTAARAVLFGAFGLAILRFRALPVWTGWVNLIFGAASFLGLFALVDPNLFGTIWFLTFMLSFVWILILSIVMTSAKRRTAEPAAG